MSAWFYSGRPASGEVLRERPIRPPARRVFNGAMTRFEQATDAIERALQGHSGVAQVSAGLALVALGLLATAGVARRFERAIPRPAPPPPPPRLAETPARWPALARVAAWVALRLGRGPPPSMRPALLPLSVLIVLAAGMAGTGVARRFAASSIEASTPGADLRAFAVATLLVAATLLLFLLAWTRRLGGGLGDLGVTFRRAGPSLALALAAYVAYAPVQLGAMAIESGAWSLAGSSAPRQAAVVAFAGDPALQRDLLVLAGVVVGAPLYEELLFRGVLQAFVRRLLPAWPAIAATALAFTLPHDGGWLPVLALGAALSWLMARTGNLLAPLLFHMLHNGLVLFVIARTGGA